jgi:hypothetical protein
MPAFLSKPANVLSITLVLIVLGVLTYLGATTLKPSGRGAVAHAILPPTAAELREALSVAGLSAQPLAAAGVQQAQVSGVVGNARSYLSNNGASFRAALSSYRDSSLQVEDLERRVRTGQASEADVSDLAAARTALTTAGSSREAAIAALVTAATTDLSSTVVETLASLRSNRDKEVPVQYKVSARTQAQWLALREALANQRISARYGEEADGPSHQLVLDTNAETAVSSAISSLGNLATVTSAWNSAVNQ